MRPESKPGLRLCSTGLGKRVLKCKRSCGRDLNKAQASLSLGLILTLPLRGAETVDGKTESQI